MPNQTCLPAFKLQCPSRPSRPSHQQHRPQPSGITVCQALALSLLMLLQACGGGGGGDSASGGPGEPVITPPVANNPGLPSTRVSAATPVAAGCTGGGAAVGTLYANAEVEPFLARSPVDPEHWVAVWQQDRWSDGASRAIVSASSRDGGRTWVRVLHPFSRCGGAAAGSAGDFERASDPWVDIGSDGSVHVMALAVSGANFTATARSAMLASRSSDGGRTFSAPQALQADSGAGFLNDKNTLTVNPLDPRFVYAVWDRLEANDNGPTWLARSSDAGQSWQPAREIYRPAAAASGTAQTIGNRIVVLPGGAARGTLVNVFTEIVVAGAGTNASTSTSTRVRVLRSADNGASWGAPITVADLRSVGTRDPTTGAVVRDGGIIPNIAAGPDGSLWVAWQDSRFSNGVRDAIALSRSSDGGLSWSPPVAANRNLAVAAFTPSLVVRADGLLGLAYFDFRPDTVATDTLFTAAWLVSTRDGSSFTEAALWPQFDLAPAPNARGLFLGDYQGLVSLGNEFVALLALSAADSNNRSDIYTLRVTPSVTATAQLALVATGASNDSARALSAAEINSRSSANTAAYMDQRVPGWAQRRFTRSSHQRP